MSELREHNAKRLSHLFGLAALIAVGGCQVEAPRSESDVASTQGAITGGIPDLDFPGACAMQVDQPAVEPDAPEGVPTCSCMLIGERVVLTAAHCVFPIVDLAATDDTAYDRIDLRFGEGYEAGTRAPVAEVVLSRYYDPEVLTLEDIALILLEDPAPAGTNPVPVNAAPLEALEFAGDLTLVGYGGTAEDEGSFGARRRVGAPISSKTRTSVVAGTESATSCAGDGGGPGLFDFGSGPVVVSVNSRIAACTPATSRTRVDLFAAFIQQFINAYEGPCATDGTCNQDPACVDAGGNTIDPDCDECLPYSGDCQVEGCATRDFDCPVDEGVQPGQGCTLDGECERGGRCVAAVDDEAFTYCSQPCNPNAASPGCPALMACTDFGDGTGECEYGTPSPGSQGFPCSFGDQCRSGICEDEICVIECASDADCPEAPAGQDPYLCGPSEEQAGAQVCLGKEISGGGGFCEPSSVAGRGGAAGQVGGIAVLLLAALMLVFTGRRRR